MDECTKCKFKIASIPGIKAIISGLQNGDGKFEFEGQKFEIKKTNA